MLSDHQGAPFYSQKKSKLVQREYKEEKGNLIAPFEIYEKLVEGTLISVQISLSLYNMKAKAGTKFLDSKINHANVEKLTILDPDYGAAWNPEIPILPTLRTLDSGREAHLECR
ncbi:hypothetical protein B0H14DRAFT_2573072 [Mycena olivaceomarginata]|nr:hypothetical protein B0H14DRAFT_2573072 [Mycena olivaceomarginata]